MRSMILLSIRGDLFFFEDNGFFAEHKRALQNIADLVSQKNPQEKIATEKEICYWFIDEVKANLAIDLVRVDISFVIRINYPS